MNKMVLMVMLLESALAACGRTPAYVPAAVAAGATPAPVTFPPVSSLSSTEVSMALQLTSPVFIQGNPIPAVYTCTGRNISPALAWGEPPSGTQAFALIMDDPDAPGGTWTHWVLFNLPGSTRSLSENVPPGASLPDGSLQGKNSWGNAGYGGPCPPSGTHRYFFKLFALDRALDLTSGADAARLVKAMQGHVLAKVELMGTYRK